MHITILYQKMEQKQVCEQSLGIEKYYVNILDNSKRDFLITIIDVLLVTYVSLITDVLWPVGK